MIQGSHSLRARLYTGTSAEWSASTTVYRAGALLFDSQTNALKIADGTNSYSGLSFVAASGAGVEALSVINKTGVSIAADKIVATSGLDATSGKPKIILADADVASSDDLYVTSAAIADQASGTVLKFALSAANLNTSGATSAGDPVFLSAATAGAFAHAAPTGNDDRTEPVGFVVVKDAAIGQIRWIIGEQRTIGTDQLQALSVTQAKLALASLDGTIAKVVADANVIGGIELVFRVAIADASADTDVVMTHKVRVLKFDFLNTGIGAHATLDTVQLKNGATAITDAVPKTATVNKLVTASTYDPAQVEIAAAGTLRVAAVKSTNVAGVAIIRAVRVA